MSLDTIEALLVEQLQDLYYAEKHLVKALPKMAKAASTAELKEAFTAHASETEAHVARLELVFEALGVSAKAKKCPAIDGLLAEAAEMMAESGEPAVLDAGLIASAQRVEHYEMAAYGNMKAFAEALGRDDAAMLFAATLEEEHAADRLLTKISRDTVVPAALLVGKQDAEETDEDDGLVAAGKSKGTAKGGGAGVNGRARSR